MKTNGNFFLISVYIALFIVCTVITAGCTSGTTSAPSVSPIVSSTAIPVSIDQTPVQTPTRVPTTTVSLSNGVTITYPIDWQKEETSETSLRDYGRITTNFANFYSPSRCVGSCRNADNSYTTLSIDVDPLPGDEIEDYFNLATLALQKRYGRLDITNHYYQYRPTAGGISGYKAYRLDFATESGVTGMYFFTEVKGMVYIFAFKNPGQEIEIKEMVDSIKIILPDVTLQKHR